MPPTSRPLRKLGFLTIGLFDEADPRRGHESTLEIIELGERLGDRLAIRAVVVEELDQGHVADRIAGDRRRRVAEELVLVRGDRLALAV